MPSSNSHSRDQSKAQSPSALRPEKPALHHQLNVLRAASPTKRWFDPWNTSSTGHQHAKHVLSGSTVWRESRHIKLAAQFSDQVACEGEAARIGDVASTIETIQREGQKTGNGTRALSMRNFTRKGQPSIIESFAVQKATSSGTKRKLSELDDSNPQERGGRLGVETRLSCHAPDIPTVSKKESGGKHQTPSASSPDSGQNDYTFFQSVSPRSRKPLFRGLVFYINGSTYPVVSDHRLKQLIAQNGGTLVTQLLRRKVTHVIVGHDSRTPAVGKSSAQGLASGKIQKEIEKAKGERVKFIDPGWVIECIRARIRVPEGLWTKTLTASHQKDVEESIVKRRCSPENLRG